MLEWVDIPAGRVILEQGWVFNASSKEPIYSARPLRTYEVEPFLISKCPVTVAQYQAFIADRGYENEQWWQDLARRYTDPVNIAKVGNRPRTSISWYEAVAFSRWLSAKLEQRVMLPTEIQWQRSAQGDDALEYPWGRIFDQARCNTCESRIHETTPVDHYPQGQSPFGVFDLSGNVYEWCLNAYDDPSETNISGERTRACRGGAFGFSQDRARTAFRTYFSPTFRVGAVGFRVIMCHDTQLSRSG